MNSLLQGVLPKTAREHLRTAKRKFLTRKLKFHATALGRTMAHFNGYDVLPVLDACGLNLSQVSDYYSPLPVFSALKNNRGRWARPSEMVGVQYDLDAMKGLLKDMCGCYSDEFLRLPPYDEARKIGYGPGYPSVDATILYCMLRRIRPRRYIEIGSGLSTWYSCMAAEQNAKYGSPLQIKCIDPFPSVKLRATPGIEVIVKEVQDVHVAAFSELQAGDVLFIDSTHVVKIDGDVPYLFLEVLPRLNRGVIIHVHDIHFPFNIPHPTECYIFGGYKWPKWPMFWTEAMLLQAFLYKNDAFRILMSAPLLYNYSEEFLQASVPNYRTVDPANSNTHFGSMWLERVGD